MSLNSNSLENTKYQISCRGQEFVGEAMVIMKRLGFYKVKETRDGKISALYDTEKSYDKKVEIGDKLMLADYNISGVRIL